MTVGQSTRYGIETTHVAGLSGGGRTIQVEYLTGYPVAQIFAPPGQDYLSVEPMTAPTNALAGPDDALAWMPPGWRYSTAFRITRKLDA